MKNRVLVSLVMVLAQLLIGCGSQVPNLASSFDTGLTPSINITEIKTPYDSGFGAGGDKPYSSEHPFNFGTSLFYGDSLRIGVEAGFAEFPNLILSYRYRNIGLAGWTGCAINDFTYGSALIQNFEFSDFKNLPATNHIFMYEYFAHQVVPMNEVNASITFASLAYYRQYDEIGIGLGMAYAIIGIEARYGKIMRTNDERIQINLQIRPTRFSTH